MEFTPVTFNSTWKDFRGHQPGDGTQSDSKAGDEDDHGHQRQPGDGSGHLGVVFVQIKISAKSGHAHRCQHSRRQQ